MSDIDTATLIPVRVTNVAGDRVAIPLCDDGVIALDNRRLARRALRAGIVGADDVASVEALIAKDRHSGLEARRDDMRRMRLELVNGTPLTRNGMLRALCKGL